MIELQSFPQSKIDVDPIHSRPDVSSILYAGIVHDVLHSSRSHQDPYMILVHRIHKQKEYCLSVVQILPSKYQSRIDDGMQIDCTSDMINALEEVARNNNFVL